VIRLRPISHAWAGRLRRRPWLVGVVAGALLLPGAWAHAAVTPFTLEQASAKPPVAGAATPACTVPLMTHYLFRNTYWNAAPPDRNFRGTYAPPSSCTGPWSKVVLIFSARVSGTQFDRLADVYIGGAEVLSSSTSEPCCTGSQRQYVHWSVQRDVTAYSALLAQQQPVAINIYNVWDSTYNGIYDASATLSFFRGTPATAPPDAVVPVTSGGTDYYTLHKTSDRATQPVTLPRNLTRLHAELFAQGHGACEEFWWAGPNQCGVGTPYRRVAVYVDNQLAGVAPVYPVTFTGAGGPGLWEPIPSPRAWDLEPYDVDLTPFVGTLVDGVPHTVSLAVPDAAYSDPGDYWLVDANLLAWTDTNSSQTSGQLQSATKNPMFNNLTFSGVVNTSNGPITSVFRETLNASSQNTAATVLSKWAWRSTTTARGAGHTTVDDSLRHYRIRTTQLTHFDFNDDAGRSRTVDGNTTSWTFASEYMQTDAPTGIATNGVEQETYRAADSTGSCVDHTIDAANGLVVSDRNGNNCKAVAGSVPTPALPRDSEARRVV
jgi:hypothetical protein